MNFSNTPYSRSRGTKIGKLNREVCVIGVGMTPVTDTVDPKSPCYSFSDRELAAYAAQLALSDANITTNDVDAMYFSQVGTGFSEMQVCHAVNISDWVGMSGKPTYKHEEACVSSYLALDDGVMGIASGKYDVVMVCGADTGRAFSTPSQPAHIRHPLKDWKELCHYENIEAFQSLMQATNDDNAYEKWNASQAADSFEECFKLYMDRFGVTAEQIDEAVKGYAIGTRRGAALNELAKKYKNDFETEAKAHGCTVDEYYNSDKFNPRVFEHCRKVGMGIHGDGGGCAILCAAELAHKYTNHPIKISPFGTSSYQQLHPYSITRFKEESLRQLFEYTGTKSEDIDAVYAGDFSAFEPISVAEMVGYVPEGEGWKYAAEGQFAFDGSKPMNTHGGAQGFGHVWGAQAFEFMREAIMQMRGECGERQIKKLLNTVLLSGWGGNRCNAACILQKMD